ncbi:hypothetical protein [Streptomyces lydicus]|uniref:hypothetical protein n=1 Tax=Streptomyces lydicus TaxID=47763 RepID=UPI003791EFCF
MSAAQSPSTDLPPARYDDLRALVFNCTLKRSPERSNTQGLIDRSVGIMEAQGVHVDNSSVTKRVIELKHCAMNVLYSLQHLGYTIPPQADAGWIGEASPGPSSLDPGSGGPDNDFTNRNTTFMTWNLLHVARTLKDTGGIPAYGNQRTTWDAGCRHDYENPEHR